MELKSHPNLAFQDPSTNKLITFESLLPFFYIAWRDEFTLMRQLAPVEVSYFPSQYSFYSQLLTARIRTFLTQGISGERIECCLFVIFGLLTPYYSSATSSQPQPASTCLTCLTPVSQVLGTVL